jgi:AcrR family transcriptional regulator
LTRCKEAPKLLRRGMVAHAANRRTLRRDEEPGVSSQDVAAKVSVPRKKRVGREASGHAFDRDKQREHKRLALVYEAAKLINERGAGSVSLEDVGASLNISKAAVYYYFRSKQDLLFACYSMSFDVWESALDEAQAGGRTGAEKVEIFVRRYLRDGLAELQPMILVREQETLQATLHQKVERRRRTLRNRLRAFIADGIEDGSLRAMDPKVASTIIGASISWLLRTYRPDGGLGQDAFIDEALGLLLRGMRSDAGPRGTKPR